MAYRKMKKKGIVYYKGGNEAALFDGGQTLQHALRVYVVAGCCICGWAFINLFNP